jgi:hypothetical protein
VRRRAAALRVAGGLLLAAVVTTVLPGPPFFSHYSSPFAATVARSAAGESLAQNGAYRTEFWREAAEVFVHHPLAGSGFHAMATASELYTPATWAHAPLAHDGYLQPLTDGGLLLGVPFLLSALVVLSWAFRRIRRLAGDLRSGPADTLAVAFVVALLAAFAHSAVDFDWSHPSILVETALLAVCIAPPVAVGGRPRAAQVLTAGAAGLLVAALAVCVPALHQWQRDQPSVTASTGELLDAASAPFGDFRPARLLLETVASGRRAIGPAQAARALSLTAAAARVDVQLELYRDQVGASAGVLPGAAMAARATLARLPGGGAQYVAQEAAVFLAAGEASAAKRLLADDIAGQERMAVAQPDLFEELQLWASAFGRGSGYACELDAVAQLPGGVAVSALPPPTARCRPR